MFVELLNQTWTAESGVTVTNFTDTSIDGSCKKIVWVSAEGKDAVLSFTSFDMTNYEELSFYIYVEQKVNTSSILRITIDGVDYDFFPSDFKKGWNHITFDCSGFGIISSIVFTSLVDDLVLLFDYIGCRYTNFNCDEDVVISLKQHITLNYGTETKLRASAAIGDANLQLTDWQYITDTAVLELEDKSGNTEQVELEDSTGNIRTQLKLPFPSGSTVRVLCPVRGEDMDDINPDPICGIVVFDLGVEKDLVPVKTVNKVKLKEHLGKLGVAIYIDCSYKLKVLQMAREYAKKYGKEFQFLLDGERVDAILDNSLFVDSEIGNNPRMIYYYRIQPQPYLYMKVGQITDFDITMSSSTGG